MFKIIQNTSKSSNSQSTSILVYPDAVRICLIAAILLALSFLMVTVGLVTCKAGLIIAATSFGIIALLDFCRCCLAVSNAWWNLNQVQLKGKKEWAARKNLDLLTFSSEFTVFLWWKRVANNWCYYTLVIFAYNRKIVFKH